MVTIHYLAASELPIVPHGEVAITSSALPHVHISYSVSEDCFTVSWIRVRYVANLLLRSWRGMEINEIVFYPVITAVTVAGELLHTKD